jgi:hypothetical protein
MELISLAVTGAKYLLEKIAGSKVVDQAKEKALGKFFAWMKKKVFHSSNTMEGLASSNEPQEEKLELLQQELLKALQNEDFRKAYEKQLIKYEEHNMKGKNIVSNSEFKVAKTFHVGDTSYGG